MGSKYWWLINGIYVAIVPTSEGIYCLFLVVHYLEFAVVDVQVVLFENACGQIWSEVEDWSAAV